MIEKTNFQGWPNCYRLSNDLLDLVVTTDVGPRIIHFGFTGEANEFATFTEMLGRRQDAEWMVYGGHRLWHAPEDISRTYEPDNSPLQLERLADHAAHVRLVQATEETTGIQKVMEIRLDPRAATVWVTHRLYNRNLWPVELAPWALSVMAPGGVAIAPLPPRRPHPEALKPASALSLWAYTDMSDARWTWGQELIMLRQDSSSEVPQKVGIMDLDGWVAYARAGHLFVKTFTPSAEGNYPDFGASVELFTNEAMLEVETLGSLVTLEPGTCATHLEGWHLFRDVKQPESEAQALAHVLPLIGMLKSD